MTGSVSLITADLSVVDRAANQLRSPPPPEQRARGSSPAVQLKHGVLWRRCDVSVVRVRIRHRLPILSGSRARGAETEEEEESLLPDQDEVPQQLRHTAPTSARRKQQQHAVHDPLPDRQRDQTHLQQLPGSRAAGRWEDTVQSTAPGTGTGREEEEEEASVLLWFEMIIVICRWPLPAYRGNLRYSTGSSSQISP